MDYLKKIWYIQCKECNNDKVCNPNFDGLCLKCKEKNEKNRDKNIELCDIIKFLNECSNERRNELLASLLIHNNHYPIELKNQINQNT